MTPDQFAARHPARKPGKAPEKPDQLRHLTPEDGVLLLSAPPFPNPVSGRPGYPEGRYLWVLFPPDLPVILETAPGARPPPLESKGAKHTNLTGGRDACCGGELWVDEVAPDLLYVNGGSGRYTPRTRVELDEAVSVFKALGFRVINAGWDEEHDRPARTFRETS